jgi:hypothetical protein
MVGQDDKKKLQRHKTIALKRSCLFIFCSGKNKGMIENKMR